MMRFKDKDLIYKCKSEEQQRELFAYAKSKGVPVSSDGLNFDLFPCLAWMSGLQELMDNRKNEEYPKQEISETEFREACDNWALDYGLRFKDQDLFYKCQTREEFDELFNYADKNRVVISKLTRRTMDGDMLFPYLTWEKMVGKFKLRSMHRGFGKEITKEQFKECCDNWALDYGISVEGQKDEVVSDVTKETIARMVKDHLEQTGISGRKFAKEAGVSRETINGLIAGRRPNLTLDVFLTVVQKMNKKIKILDN